MNLTNSHNLTAFGIAFLISAIASFPIMKLLIAMKSRQTVSQHAPEGHQKKQGTPTMGGIIILVGFFGALPFIDTSVVNWYTGAKTTLLPMAVLMALFALIGFVDDFVVPKLMPGKRGLGWKQKILMQVVAAVVPLYLAGYTDPMMVGYGTFLILFFANAYNFSDGLDWLAGTLLVGLLIGMYALTVNSVQMTYERTYSQTLIFVMLGALIPFLFWNKPKAKVFMGDVGSLPIGAFLGGFWFLQRFDITATTANPFHKIVPGNLFFIALGIWSLMMVAELVPVPLQIASVKIRKKKIFPYTPIHHAFEKAGWPETKVVLLFSTCQLAFSLVAIGVVALAK